MRFKTVCQNTETKVATKVVNRASARVISQFFQLTFLTKPKSLKVPNALFETISEYRVKGIIPKVTICTHTVNTKSASVSPSEVLKANPTLIKSVIKITMRYIRKTLLLEVLTLTSQIKP